MNDTGRDQDRHCLAWVLGGVVLGWIFLQIVRSRFFLTDDTFSLFFPVFVSMGRSLWAGEPFWICQDIFGGGYNLALDSQMVPLFHPLTLTLSLLAQTALQSWLMDVLALVNLLLAAAGMVYLIGVLDRRGLVEVRGGWRIWVSLSWTFSMYSLLLGSSGIWYLANVAALPWLVAAAVHPRGKPALGLMAVAVFHAAVGGYPSCFLFSMLSLAFPLAWKAHVDGWRRLGPPVLGMVAGAVLVLPFFLPSIRALSDSLRSGSIPVEVASEGRFALPVLLASLGGGSISARFGEISLFGKLAHAYALGISALGAVALLSFYRRRGAWSSWDGVLGLGFLFGALWVSRPDWFGQFLFHLPVLGALRWPYKEMFVLVFWMHLFALRGTLFSPRLVGVTAVSALVVFSLPFVFAGSPSLNEHALSRRFYFSGEAQSHWERLRAQDPPLVVPALSSDDLGDITRYPSYPWIMMGSHNFTALWGVRSWTGYSATMPRRIFEREPRMGNVYGVLKIEDAEVFWGHSAGWVLFYDSKQPNGIILRRAEAPSKTWLFLSQDKEKNADK